MNKHYRPHIGGYSQTGWEIQTTWERRKKVAKTGLMASINPGQLNLSGFIYKS
jgi:hypothetical protein